LAHEAYTNLMVNPVQDNRGKPTPARSTIQDFNEAWNDGMPVDHMQIICISLHRDNHTSTLSLTFSRPAALSDIQLTVSKHWRYLTYEAILWNSKNYSNTQRLQVTIQNKTLLTYYKLTDMDISLHCADLMQCVLVKGVEFQLRIYPSTQLL